MDETSANPGASGENRSDDYLRYTFSLVAPEGGGEGVSGLFFICTCVYVVSILHGRNGHDEMCGLCDIRLYVGRMIWVTHLDCGRALLVGMELGWRGWQVCCSAITLRRARVAIGCDNCERYERNGSLVGRLVDTTRT